MDYSIDCNNCFVYYPLLFFPLQYGGMKRSREGTKGENVESGKSEAGEVYLLAVCNYSSNNSNDLIGIGL
jgi:hypothetical protein